jgi:RNA polymerase sigma-70 factor (ECF subfamily)
MVVGFTWMDQSIDPISKPNVAASFLTTRWSQVVAATEPGVAGEAALGRLCEAYWRPLYFYVRRRGHGPEEAQDLTQEFFLRLLSGDWLERADPARGRFRTYLLTVMQRLLADTHRRASTAKRGGNAFIETLDWTEAEAHFSVEPMAPGESPEQAFDRRWATTLMDRALTRLRADCASAGRSEYLTVLEPFLSAEPEPGDYAVAAGRLQVSPNGIAQSVLRLRSRYREMIRAEIDETVTDDVLAELEWQELRNALRRR